MARPWLNASTRALSQLQTARQASSPSRLCATCIRAYTTPTNEPPTPPLLLKLREDLKAALRSKDKTRLNVLRAVLAEVTNQSKRSPPIKTDTQVLSILRKRTAASKQASEEFQKDNRKDLSDKEDAEIHVLEEYAETVKTLGYEEVKKEVEKTIDEITSQEGKVDKGKLLRILLKPGGPFEGKPVEATTVARVVQEIFANRPKDVV